MNTPEYLQRKREKFAHYDAEYGKANWWFWDVADKTEMPVLPSRSAKQ